MEAKMTVSSDFVTKAGHFAGPGIYVEKNQQYPLASLGGPDFTGGSVDIPLILSFAALNARGSKIDVAYRAASKTMMFFN